MSRDTYTRQGLEFLRPNLAALAHLVEQLTCNQ